MRGVRGLINGCLLCCLIGAPDDLGPLGEEWM